MTLKELIIELGGNYDDLSERLISDESIERYIRFFLTDSTFDRMVEALKNYDFNQAFYHAHTLKGLAQTLGFYRLSKSSNQISQFIHNNSVFDKYILLSLINEAEMNYREVVKAIEGYFVSKSND